MQELAFKYDTSCEPKRTIAFEYNYKKFNEIWLSYKRICSICNTALFSKPVAAEKATTGFFDMPALLLNKVLRAQVHDDTSAYILKDTDFFVLKDIIISKEQYGYIYKHIFAYRLIENRDIITQESLFASKELYADVYKHYLAYKDLWKTSVNKTYMGRLDDIKTIVNDTILTSSPIKQGYINSLDFAIGYQYRSINIFNINAVKTPERLGFIYDIKPIYKEDYNAFIYKHIIINKSKFYDTNAFNYTSFNINIKKAFIYSNAFGSREYRNINIHDNISIIRDMRKNVLISCIKPFTMESRIISYIPAGKWTFDINYYATLHHDEPVIKDLDNTRTLISNYSTFIPLKGKIKYINIDVDTIPFNRKSLYANIPTDISPIDILRKSMVIYDPMTNVITTHKIPHIFDETVQLYKSHKVPYIFSEKGHFAYRKSYGIFFDSHYYSDIFAYREVYEISHMINENWLYRKYRIPMISDTFGAIFRKQYKVNSDEIDLWLFRKLKDLSYYIGRGYDIYIVPAKRKDRNIFTEYMDTMVYRILKNMGLLISQEISASKMKLPIGLYDDPLFCDKDTYKLYVDYINYWAIKDRIAAMIYNGQTWANKDRKAIWSENQIWSILDRKPTWLPSDEWVTKDSKAMFTLKQEWTWKDGKAIWTLKNEWLSKDNKPVWYEKDYWSSKEADKINLYKHEWVEKERNGVTIADFSWIDRGKRNFSTSMYDYDVFTLKSLREIDLFREMEEFQKCPKDTRTDYHVGEWVWMDDYDKPFEPEEFGIDELLLPEEDTRYEDFEDIIFNKERLRPRNPVKKIDDYTWVAKYPIKHPLKRDDRKLDEGYYVARYGSNKKEYSAKYYYGITPKGSGFDQYYGIRTSIMYKVYLAFYDLWQGNLFKLSAMSMVDSLKYMLELLYKWIEKEIPPYNKLSEYMEAMRVYRQIRWFGECAIINNSQYIVSFEADDLKSHLDTGTCDIPNDLDSNNTMYINADDCAIKNRNTGEDSYVKFYIDVKRDTVIHFDLHPGNGSVNIYIDEDCVGTVNNIQRNCCYLLRYTGRTVVVKIERKAADNTDLDFAIGNIIVDGNSFKNLNIQFDPALRAGNKPLDEITRKMIAYANMSDDFEEAYQTLKERSAGISITVEQMIEYWELHHKGKVKGKRLTIKKT